MSVGAEDDDGGGCISNGGLLTAGVVVVVLSVSSPVAERNEKGLNPWDFFSSRLDTVLSAVNREKKSTGLLSTMLLSVCIHTLLYETVKNRRTDFLDHSPLCWMAKKTKTVSQMAAAKKACGPSKVFFASHRRTIKKHCDAFWYPICTMFMHIYLKTRTLPNEPWVLSTCTLIRRDILHLGSTEAN